MPTENGSNLNQTTILPTTVAPNVFTNLAWDNIDCLEETLTGEGTTHRVNGIVVQPAVSGPHLPRITPPVIEKRKQRTIKQDVQPLPVYISGERVGPLPVPPMNEQDDNEDEQLDARLVEMKDFVWLLARKARCDSQKISSWAGFNIMTRAQDVTQDVISYLPSINAPPTQLTTVNFVSWME